MPTAYLSLGSNQQPLEHLPLALAQLQVRFGELRVSPLYRTPAMGFDGPDFLNAAVILDTSLGPEGLNDWLHALEDAHGRRRVVPRVSDRPLDIDIVFYDNLQVRGAGHLDVPRPELRHAFVLKPLFDLAPDYRVPGDGRTLAELWRAHPEFAQPPETVPWPDNSGGV
jgi:2-amino-4-hydroxy-6-hydroxymethyldihydropteridine diphosphokinase